MMSIYYHSLLSFRLLLEENETVYFNKILNLSLKDSGSASSKFESSKIQ